MLSKEDAQLVGLGVAGNLLAMQTVIGLFRLNGITYEEAMEIIEKAHADLATLSGAMKNQEAASEAQRFLERASMILLAERRRQSGKSH